MAFWDGWFGSGDQTLQLNGLPPGQQFIVAGPKGEKFAGVNTANGIQVSQQPVVAGAGGANTPKTVVSKYADGSVHAVTVEGTDVTDHVLKGADPALVAQEEARTKLELARAGQIDSPEAVAKTVAQTAQYTARADQIAAMTAVNPQLAQARADRLNQQIANDAALTPAKIQSLQAGAAAKFSTVGLNAAKAGLAGAQTGLTDAKTQAMVQGAFFKLQGEYAAIDKSIGQPGGPPDQAAADALKKKIFDQVARQAATGLTPDQEGTLANTAQGQAVTQGDSRAGQMSTFLGGYGRDLTTAKMPPGSTGAGDFLGAMIGNWPALMANAGGAPVDIKTPGATPGGFMASMGADPGRVGQPEGHPATTAAQSGPSIDGLPPEDLQRIHDRTQQLSAGGGDLAGAAQQALQEYLASKGGGGTAPANMNPGVAQGAAMPGY